MSTEIDLEYARLEVLALSLAAKYHGDTVDNAGIAYVWHPIRVALHFPPGYRRIVALLHDLVEDTEVTLEFLIECGFPPEVIEAVKSLTRLDTETYAAYIERVAANEIGKDVKLADLYDNERPPTLPSLTKRYSKAKARLLVQGKTK